MTATLKVLVLIALFLALLVVVDLMIFCWIRPGLTRAVDWLIEYAKRTPYSALPGYMLRYWLVPYSTVMMRDTTLPNGRPIKMPLHDGTGPVDGRRRPIARLLQKLGVAARIHNILTSDHGRHPHNHPWWFVTIILRGGYWETMYDSQGFAIHKKWHGPGSILFRTPKHWHRIDLRPGVQPWTLFITGRYKGTWGFLVKGTFVQHREYLRRDL